MARIELGRILDDLDAFGEMFRMDRDKLGEKLCAAATEGVKGTIAREEAPDGTPWDQLSTAYEEWKSQAYPGKPMAFLEGLMADEGQLAGEIEITPDEASTTYGTTEEARLEAEWFQEGDDENNRPPRPFFDFTAESLAAIDQILDDRFDIIK